MKAVDKFEYKEVCFQRITCGYDKHNKINSHQARTIRISSYDRNNKNCKNPTQIMSEFGREPPEELAKTSHAIRKVRKVLYRKEPVSLETPVGDEEDIVLIYRR